MKKIPTIRDVAKKVGVSISTVSRVMNDSPRISDDTKKKVLKIIKEMNYEPNYIARGLSKKKTDTVGVILEDIENPFFSEIAKGIEMTLQKSNYSMLLTNSNFEEEKEIRFVKLLLRYKVDGIIIAPLNRKSKSISLVKESDIPYFVLNCSSNKKDFNWISTDNLTGGYRATKYLLDLGHLKIMLIKGTDDQPSQDKYRGFCKAIREKKLSLSDQIVVKEKAKNYGDGKRIMKKFLKTHKLKNLPTAIFAINDDVAAGVMDSLSKGGIRVPEDISIIGYDDVKFADYFSLTTIRQEKYKMGKMAAFEIILNIENEERDTIKQLLIEPKLIIRESCRKRN